MRQKLSAGTALAPKHSEEKLLKKYGSILIALIAVLLTFRLLRGWQFGMDLLSRYIIRPLQAATGWLTSFVPFSVAEVLTVTFFIFCTWYLSKAVYDICKKKHCRFYIALQKSIGMVVIGVSLYTGFTLFWGLNYYTTSFEQQAGIQVQPISVQELADTMQLFANRVNATAPNVSRDASGVFAVPPNQILENARGLYTALEQKYPFLYAPAQITAKPMMLSHGMSIINYTGIFFPFTGEANVNIETPGGFLPSTVAHELAHVHGIGPEQTANFVAILACESSGKPEYMYSGYLLGYLHLSNALYGADRALWRQVSATLCAEARADWNANMRFWRQYDTMASKAADTVYNGFLQSYDQELGLKSYGAVVDLLVAYYAGQAHGLAAI